MGEEKERGKESLVNSINEEENVYDILSRIQKELKVPKKHFNDFGRYFYRSCEDICEAIKPLLPKGVALTITDTIVLRGNRYYVKATAKLQYKTEEIAVEAYAREPETKKGMDESQITGTASSYARKYALNGLLLADDTKDADSMGNRENDGEKRDVPDFSPPATPPPPLAPGSSLHKRVEVLISEAGIDRGLFKEWLESVAWLEKKDDKLSLLNLPEKNARYLCDKWESAKKTFSLWVDKKGQKC